MEPTIEHSPVRQMEDVTKRADFIMALHNHQLSTSIKPMYLPYGMKLIDTPNLVKSDGSA